MQNNIYHKVLQSADLERFHIVQYALSVNDTVYETAGVNIPQDILVGPRKIEQDGVTLLVKGLESHGDPLLLAPCYCSQM